MDSKQQEACNQTSRANNISIVCQLPDHVARSLQHPLHESTSEPFPPKWSDRVQCVRAAHIISHLGRRNEATSIGETSHTCDFAPFINQVVCQKKQHEHGVLLLGIRRSKVQTKAQSHMLVWNVFEKDPVSRVMTNGQYYTVSSRLKTVKNGNLIPLFIPTSDKEEWAYMATMDQVKPENLRVLSDHLFSSADSATTKESLDPALHEVYSQGFYLEPDKTVFSSDVSTLVNTPLASSIVLMYDFYFLVV